MGNVVHIAGIGGVGMSALAQALLDQGRTVTGSDRLLDHGDLTSTLSRLKAQGVKLFPQDGSGIDRDTARLVVSSAIESDNPDKLKAETLGIPVVHRADELAAALSGRTLVAVAGTCGKSSVTAMLGHLLVAAGFDPLVVNGAEVGGWDDNGRRIGSVHFGTGKWAVAEVDESDKSLMAFSPDHAIITNASADHFGMDETQELFSSFRAKIPGVVIDGRSETGLPQDVELSGWSGSFTLDGTRYTVPMPGMHNVMNSWHAVRMALALGADPQTLQAALPEFKGISRRLQRVGQCDGAMVVDDYAHNPEKLAAAWKTLSSVAPNGICAVWRPHGYAPLRKMLNALTDMFAQVCRHQDRLILLPVYDAGGTANRSVSSGDLAEQLHLRGVNVQLANGIPEAEAIMRAAANQAGVLATFGARDPDLPRLAQRLAAK